MKKYDISCFNSNFADADTLLKTEAPPAGSVQTPTSPPNQPTFESIDGTMEFPWKQKAELQKPSAAEPYRVAFRTEQGKIKGVFDI